MNYKRLFIPNSMVFITIKTKCNKKILINNIQFLRDAFRRAKQKYDFDIIAIVINPDHIHMIIKPYDINLYPKIVSYIKRSFTILSKLPHKSNKNRESDIWQRRYWEHTIRNEQDLYRHIDYIHFNPMKHYNIAPKDWKYSTFNKFVQNGYYEPNWCNFKDINNISKMNLE